MTNYHLHTPLDGAALRPNSTRFGPSRLDSTRLDAAHCRAGERDRDRARSANTITMAFVVCWRAARSSMLGAPATSIHAPLEAASGKKGEFITAGMFRGSRLSARGWTGGGLDRAGAV